MYNQAQNYNAVNSYPCQYLANGQMYEQDYSRQYNEQYNPFDAEMYYDFDFNAMRQDNGNDLGEDFGEDLGEGMEGELAELKDYGPEPFVIDINEATKRNDTFRTALWTGSHLQITLMSIKPGEEIGLENHPNLDQFLRVEEGEGIVKMGKRKDNLDFQREVADDFAIVIPANTWHNLINTGTTPLKLYSIYAPPQHPRGTVHETKADAEAAERYRHRKR
jgi:mannose-6-phosphate isomerase-like protein (cupin superfamily)